MLQGAVGAALGEKLVRALLFPLGYALLLVPFGEELVPLLQTFTAHISVVLLHLSGIAAEMQGVFITTKAGFFEVAEECSGVNFLIAMLAYSVFAAHLCFKSWTRRSEEHTSELQSLMRISYAVFCLKKKNKIHQ